MEMTTNPSKEENLMMNVVIKQLDGQSLNIECSLEATVLGLKTMISEKQNLTIDRQRLIYRAQELTDSERLLTDYGVSDQSVLHIVIRPVGGSAPSVSHVPIDIPSDQQGNPHAPQYPRNMGVGPAFAGNMPDMAPDTFDTYRLARFVKIFAVIDCIFSLIYGMYWQWFFFILAILAVAGIYGATKFKKYYLILYMLCLLGEIGVRIWWITGDDINAFEVVLLVIMILIDLFVLRCTIQLFRQMGNLTPQQIQTLVILNGRCF